MGTTQSRIFRMARAEIGDRDINPKTFTEVYSETVDYCLEQGYWNFASRSVQIDSSTDIEPVFGYSYVFERPTDWIRTVTVSGGENLYPLQDYLDEKSLWHANVDPLYVQYISNDSSYGLDLTAWPETFSGFVACELARRVSMRSNGGRDEYQELGQRVKRYLADARSKDAMNNSVAYPPEGRWTRARRSWGGGERGKRNTLIG